ncbi:hypothetical protein D5S17_19325 [Pseudonocardiaceae bacterium YIM PH 21723]|nr:hypothetical protein D5S17_19325 [Pseudonocardiaceae bacterium YIM PH 21723]
MSRYPTIEGELELEDETEFEWEGEFEDEFELEGEFEGLARELEDELEGEYEGEAEGEFEFEDFANPNHRASRLGIAAEAEFMVQLAANAANAESEAELEAFLGALIPAAARLLPKAAPVLKRFAPQLIKGVAQVGKKLWHHPDTRNLVRAMPGAIFRTARDLTKQWASGRQVTARNAVQSLGQNVTRGFRQERQRSHRSRSRRGR